MRLVADRFPSFLICGLPDHISGDVPDWRQLAHVRLATGVRVADENAVGGQASLAGSPGTQVVKVFDLAVARTGLRDAVAAAAGYGPVTVGSEEFGHKVYDRGAHSLQLRLHSGPGPTVGLWCVHHGSGSSLLVTPTKGASMTVPATTMATRTLQIEFLFLDLDTCTRCRATDATLLEAIDRTHPALEAAGVAVSVTKTLVASEAQAQSLAFASSPTIRINGVDIAGELVESACDSCSETCACNGGVDCRDWVWQGRRSQEPPLGLIVEAIMRHASGPDPASVASSPPGSATVPANLRQYFAAAAADTSAADCCSVEEQAGCCHPEHKAACCGNGVAAAACGCQA